MGAEDGWSSLSCCLTDVAGSWNSATPSVNRARLPIKTTRAMRSSGHGSGGLLLQRLEHLGWRHRQLGEADRLRGGGWPTLALPGGGRPAGGRRPPDVICQTQTPLSPEPPAHSGARAGDQHDLLSIRRRAEAMSATITVLTDATTMRAKATT